jgi:cell division protein DivIC
MNLKKIRKNRFIKIITNVFVLILIPFLIWMTFIDNNSYLVHRKLDHEINDLERTISFYKKKIEEDKATIKNLKDSLQLERFAREKYLMKKDKEDIYLIEFDTIK